MIFLIKTPNEFERVNAHERIITEREREGEGR